MRCLNCGAVSADADVEKEDGCCPYCGAQNFDDFGDDSEYEDKPGFDDDLFDDEDYDYGDDEFDDFDEEFDEEFDDEDFEDDDELEDPEEDF